MLKRTGPRLAALACACLTSLAATPATAAPPSMGGEMVAESEGRIIRLPLLRSDIAAEVAGDLATVQVVQTFANPGTVPLNATYLFPLNETAAVSRMTMTIGETVIEARIAERSQARADFDQARHEGRQAALLEQHRSNMFRQSIANLMPGQPIIVSLRYEQTVPRIDGAYELVIPLVVGPRYDEPPAKADSLEASTVPDGEGGPAGHWHFGPAPAYPPVAGLTAPPDVVEHDRIGLTVRLDGGMPIAEVRSQTHALAITEETAQRRILTLAEGGTLDNRDFVLRYRLAGEAPAAGLLAHRDDRGGFFSLLIEPPQVPVETDIARREIVFVVDCSGSMAGLPLEAGRAFMHRALQRLRPSDSFRIIRFSDAAAEFSATPLPASPANIHRGQTYIAALQGGGGTNMSLGIRQALAVPLQPGTLRLVTFLTDGYIGDEAEVLRLIHRHLGAARLFAFGVGTGVNRFLLNEMGRIGRGFTHVMEPHEDVAEIADALTQRMQSPLLTDLTVDWGTLAPRDLTHDALPDLFAGQSLRLQGRYDRPGRYTVRVRGTVNGRTAELPLTVDLPASGGHGEAIATIWARQAIERDMGRLIMPPSLRPGLESDADLQARITDLGLTFSLVTQWTSFVATSDHITNQRPEDTVDVAVPLPMVAGVGATAYGTAAPAGVFPGHATPEPGITLGVLAVMLMLAWAAKRRHQSA